MLIQNLCFMPSMITNAPSGKTAAIKQLYRKLVENPLLIQIVQVRVVFPFLSSIRRFIGRNLNLGLSHDEIDMKLLSEANPKRRD